MTSIDKESFNDFIEHLHFSNIPYRYEKCGTSMKVKSSEGDYQCTSSSIPRTQLWFISKVKKHIMSKKIKKDKTSKSSVSYFEYSNFKKSKEFKKVFEVDISNAYWRTAYNLGFISESIYHEGNTLDKVTRLAALGALARNPTKVNFDGKREKITENKPDKKTSFIWFQIAKKIGDIMKEARILLGSDFIFFWVDGIYFKKEKNIKFVQSLIDFYNYQSKVKKIKKIKIDLNTRQLFVHEHKKKTRPFYL